jgi:hypothetical protein
MPCCKPHCGKSRYEPWYLCYDCLNAWIVFVLACEPEEEKRSEQFAPALKPRKGGGGPGGIEQPQGFIQRVVTAVAGR